MSSVPIIMQFLTTIKPAFEHFSELIRNYLEFSAFATEAHLGVDVWLQNPKVLNDFRDSSRNSRVGPPTLPFLQRDRDRPYVFDGFRPGQRCLKNSPGIGIHGGEAVFAPPEGGQRRGWEWESDHCLVVLGFGYRFFGTIGPWISVTSVCLYDTRIFGRRF